MCGLTYWQGAAVVSAERYKHQRVKCWLVYLQIRHKTKIFPQLNFAWIKSSLTHWSQFLKKIILSSGFNSLNVFMCGTNNQVFIMGKYIQFCDELEALLWVLSYWQTSVLFVTLTGLSVTSAEVSQVEVWSVCPDGRGETSVLCLIRQRVFEQSPRRGTVSWPPLVSAGPIFDFYCLLNPCVIFLAFRCDNTRPLSVIFLADILCPSVSPFQVPVLPCAQSAVCLSSVHFISIKDFTVLPLPARQVNTHLAAHVTPP